RVGWLPFAGISLPGAEALRLLVMDYERDTSWSLLRICRPPPGAAAGLYTHRTPMSCRRKANLRSTSRPAKLRTGDRSKARQRPRAKRPRGDASGLECVKTANCRRRQAALFGRAPVTAG